MEYYSAKKRNETELVYEVDESHRYVMQSEVSQKEKNMLIHIYIDSRKEIYIFLNLFSGRAGKDRQWGKERVAQIERVTLIYTQFI